VIGAEVTGAVWAAAVGLLRPQTLALSLDTDVADADAPKILFVVNPPSAAAAAPAVALPHG